MKSKTDRIGRNIETLNVNHPDELRLFKLQLRRYFSEMHTIATRWLNDKTKAPVHLGMIDHELYDCFGLTSQALRHLHKIEELDKWDRKRTVETALALAAVHLGALVDKFDVESLQMQLLGKTDDVIGLIMAVSSDPMARFIKGFDHAGWARMVARNATSMHIISEVSVTDNAHQCPPIELTGSQRELREKLEAFWALKQSARRVGGYDPRPIPLIVGPSGSGKSALVRSFAANNKLALRDFNVGTWIITGSRTDPQSLVEIADFVRRNERGVLFIDEVDKLSGTSDWVRSLQQEIFALLDGRTDSFVEWDAEIRAKFERNFFLVGAGTWQNLYARSQRAAGFMTPSEADWSIDLTAQSAIPEELLMRFNADVLYLEPLGIEEFSQRIANIVDEVGLPALAPQRQQLLAEQAHASGRHNRWLEAYASRLLRRQATKEAA